MFPKWPSPSGGYPPSIFEKPNYLCTAAMDTMVTYADLAIGRLLIALLRFSGYPCASSTTMCPYRHHRRLNAAESWPNFIASDLVTSILDRSEG